MSKLTARYVKRFHGCYTPPTTVGADDILAKITKTAGTPTIKTAAGGVLQLALDSANEVQNLSIFQNDVLEFPIANLIRVEFLANVSAALNAAVTGFFGVGSTRNDAIASIAQRAGFLFGGAGGNAVTIDAVDGTNSNTGKATGQTLVGTLKRFAIDFSIGNLAQSPPSASKGGVADVRFFMGNATGYLNEVARMTRFDLSAYTGNLQLIAQIQKTANAATGTLGIAEIAVEYRLN
jgi:hypothetical protein